MRQVDGVEFETNLSQLAELVPVETINGSWHHGMVCGSVAVYHISEDDFHNASEDEKITIIRRGYINCLRVTIERATELLEAMAQTTGTVVQYRNVVARITASLNAGHTVVDPDNVGGVDAA